MTDLFLPFGSPAYLGMLGVLALARGADFLSTWVASPQLLLESNPLARHLGWRGGLVFNLGLAVLVASWLLPAVILATASLLVAARNFQSAWLARSMGEEAYRQWLGERLAHTGRGLYVACIAAQAGLVGVVGAALVWTNPLESLAAAVGLGVLSYALAVLIYPLLGARRIWRQLSSRA
jgi:hypothetical protein